MFRMASSGSTNPMTEAAVQAAAYGIMDRLGQIPDYVMVHTSVAYDLPQVQALVRQHFPTAQIHGATSCLGALSAQGVMQEDGRGLALLAIRDEDGEYGTGCAAISLEASSETNLGASSAAVAAVEAAMERAGRPGQTPDLIWVSASPGAEEDVLQGVQQMVGPDVVIVGGSSADNDISGQWRVFDHHVMKDSGVVVSVFYPSVTVGTAFQCTYDPTEKTGTVTKADGRVVYEIDGRPAREVYDLWTDGLLADCPVAEITNILGLSSLAPLGRRVTAVGGIDFHVLSHPETVRPDGSLSLFTEVSAGDQFTPMQGTTDMLVTRASKVVRSAQTIAEVEREEIAGAIVVYCAGCMLTVQERVPDIYQGLKNALGDAPFIGTFTFGEQGRLITEENRHGNLMVSTVVFGGAQ